MATIRAFQSLRPPKNLAARIAAVPYDVVSTQEARELAAGNPLSFLHVSRPEIDLPDDTNPYSEIVYQKAVENFERLKREAELLIEHSPSLYIYQLQMGAHQQTGIAACCSIEEYDSNIIRKHERTRKDKEDDRTRHILALRAQTGPAFLTYRGRGDINEIVGQAQSSEPLYGFNAADGVRHTIWRLSNSLMHRLIEAFQSVPLLYIADGHHRAAAAARARTHLKSENPNHTGQEEYNFLLAVLFPSDQLQILPYNRVVKDLNGMSPEEFINALSERFAVSQATSPTPQKKGEICIYLKGRWLRLQLQAERASSLDVSILEELVLKPLLGIKDVRTDRRIDFVGGIRGTAALEQMVNDGRAAVAFSLYPVSVDELIAIADANQIMPPKSTWFEPKLRDGLLIHLI
jgi:uncharacterized protein (DUF1015 family)